MEAATVRHSEDIDPSLQQQQHLLDDYPSDAEKSLQTSSHNGAAGASPSTPTDSDLEHISTSAQATPEAVQEKKPSKPPSWSSLPRKDQLAILTTMRLAEPIVQTSISAYMFFMLQSFDPALSDADVSWRAGLLSSSFTAAQAVTAMFWGRLADNAAWGRKSVLLIGLSGTFVSTIGFGFSTSFWMALFFRTLGGALNGNTGVMRTMISETVVEKKYQPKAFLLMPLTFNVGTLVGPMLGGYLSDPVAQYPHLFASGPWVADWMRVYPYALPNLVTSLFLIGAVCLTLFGLEETHRVRKYRRDRILDFGRRIGRFILRLVKKKSEYAYTHLATSSVDMELSLDLEMETSPQSPARRQTATQRAQAQLHTAPDTQTEKPTKIFTRNVVATLITHGVFAAHVGTFKTLWFIFLSTPRAALLATPPTNSHAGAQPQHPEYISPLAGGLSFSPQSLGLAMSIIGVVGLALQFGVYGRITHRFGVLRTFKFAAVLFPIVYCLVPLLVFIPASLSSSPSSSSQPSTNQQSQNQNQYQDQYTPQPQIPPLPLWLSLTPLLSTAVLARTFALPGIQIMINNCAPSPAVLGTIHGAGTSVSAAGRSLGPLLFSGIYALSLRAGNVGFAWWGLAVQALLVLFTVRFVGDVGV